MSDTKKVVVDANILVRGLFGRQVVSLMETYEETIAFCTPEYCIEEARRNTLAIAAHRDVDAGEAEFRFEQLTQRFIEVVDRSFYELFEEEACARIARRDPDDWPIVATALLLNAPIWTEDRDFFGCGIATWTSDRIEIYLRDA